MDQCTHEVRMQYWKNIILQCQKRQEGMTARAWLKENGISEASYYSWLKRIRKEAYNQMKQSESLPMIQETEISFAEVKIPKHNETKTTQPFPIDRISRDFQTNGLNLLNKQSRTGRFGPQNAISSQSIIE